MFKIDIKTNGYKSMMFQRHFTIKETKERKRTSQYFKLRKDQGLLFFWQDHDFSTALTLEIRPLGH